MLDQLKRDKEERFGKSGAGGSAEKVGATVTEKKIDSIE
jgi:hypothetical protein